MNVKYGISHVGMFAKRNCDLWWCNKINQNLCDLLNHYATVYYEQVEFTQEKKGPSQSWLRNHSGNYMKLSISGVANRCGSPSDYSARRVADVQLMIDDASFDPPCGMDFRVAATAVPQTSGRGGGDESHPLTRSLIEAS
ncbi:15453_t:CDS:2, partial [Acaulospora morrowiae]